jgi:hypothetical protein
VILLSKKWFLETTKIIIIVSGLFWGKNSVFSLLKFYISENAVDLIQSNYICKYLLSCRLGNLNCHNNIFNRKPSRFNFHFFLTLEINQSALNISLIPRKLSGAEI